MKGASHDQICKMILGQLKEEGIEIEMAPLKRILCHHAMALCGIVSAGKIAQVVVFGVMGADKGDTPERATASPKPSRNEAATSPPQRASQCLSTLLFTAVLSVLGSMAYSVK